MSDEKDLEKGQKDITASAKDSEKKSKDSGKKESGGLKHKIQDLFAEHMAEYKKIIWPSRAELIKQTVTVIIISLIFGIYITGLDAIFAAGFHQFVRFLG